MKTLAHGLAFLLVLLHVFPVPAAETELGEVAFRQALLDMGTDIRVLNVAAHPDDEDGATLAYLRMHYGAKTYAVIATRGEGGQNEIGPELYNELAVIRTREMTAASEVTGAELRFLNLPEFGFSKSPEETFEIWGREETVRRLVRVIREVQPDIVLTNHDTETGHGHHRAIAAALLEAYWDAGRPDRFPEQLEEGLATWLPSRLLLREWERPNAILSVDINALDALRGLTYAEIAAEALGRHRSQGMQAFIDRYRQGESTALYNVWRGHRGLMEPAILAPGAGDDGPMLRLPDRVTEEDRAISTGTGLALSALPKPDAPPTPDATGRELALLSMGQLGRGTLAPRLYAYAARLRTSREESDLAYRRWRRANDAAALAAELRLRAEPDDSEAVPGQTVVVRATLNDFGATEATKATVSLVPAAWFAAEVSGPVTAPLEAGKPLEAEFRVRIAPDAAVTEPAAAHVFEPHFLEPQLRVSAAVQCAPAVIDVDLPLRVEVAPPVQLRFSRQRYLARVGVEEPVRLELIATGRAPGGVEKTVRVEAPPALSLPETSLSLRFEREDAERLVSLPVSWAADAPSDDYRVAARVDGSEAEALVRRVDVRVPAGVRVGVVQSYDDTLMDALEQLGVAHEALTLEDFAPERLDDFDTVLVDIRAYLVRPDLVANNQALLEYVRRGGTLVVMYQKTFEWKPEYAPYPLHVSTNRVTREDAPVELLQPEHPLFHTPNAIGAGDWEGWVQERGLYFADQWDKHYVPLIRTVDPGENIPDGSLLVAPYGDGTYVYTALVWYRQLRALHPGALRLFANLIAL